jgi:hypothetical protein
LQELEESKIDIFKGVSEMALQAMQKGSSGCKDSRRVDPRPAKWGEPETSPFSEGPIQNPLPQFGRCESCSLAFAALEK